ncbi:MAG: hypothetical protein FWF51_09130 [Chitinivibrionia bacterium]|nr:hypothetical protein [Chitinivibrionia bacterium]
MEEANFNTLFDVFLEKVKEEVGIEFYTTLYRDFTKSKSKMLRNYSDVNFYAKASYMKHKNDLLLDRHKCAACFMISVLNELDLNIDDYNSNLIKEKIAILAGLGIMHFMIVRNNHNYKDSGFISFLKDSDFEFPEPICDKNQYLKNWALELGHAYKEDRIFILSLSNELFLIEQYNRCLAKK